MTSRQKARNFKHWSSELQREETLLSESLAVVMICNKQKHARNMQNSRGVCVGLSCCALRDYTLYVPTDYENSLWDNKRWLASWLTMYQSI